MIVDLDAGVAASARAVLLDRAVDGHAQALDALTGWLERWIPKQLSVVHPAWQGESLDGITPCSVRAADGSALRLIGTCILVSDQRVMPFFVDLRLGRDAEGLAGFSLGLGESGDGSLGIRGVPYGSVASHRLFHTLPDRAADIGWAYTAEAWQVRVRAGVLVDRGAAG